MVSIETCIKLAVSFPEVLQQPHFEKESFRVNKKIFSTVDIENKRVVVKFSETDQSVFCAFDKTIIYPVSGGWGKQGWTIIELKKIKLSMLNDALTTSYCTVALPKLAALVKK